ncbi:hypothetical protein [Microseira sp. BLCC-F43]
MLIFERPSEREFYLYCNADSDRSSPKPHQTPMNVGFRPSTQTTG